MRFKKKAECNFCHKKYHNLRIFKSRWFLCYRCWRKRANIITEYRDRLEGISKKEIKEMLNGVTIK